jgi:NADPH:quinone reductase
VDKTDSSIPQTMRAVAIDHFGGPEVLHMQMLPVPKPKRSEVLIRLDAAGIGVWDPFVREGGLETNKHGFPFVIGNDGAGTVVAVGPEVTRFSAGDHVYASSMKGGFYAEYVAVSEAHVAPVPAGVKLDEAGALGIDGITALRGLEDHLRVKGDETLMIFGASGGIGHLAVQLAKRMGARVLAVASGADGVALVRRLGADVAVDGQKDDVARAAKEFAPDGLDVALVLVDGKGLGEALALVKKGGRIAHPNGVEPKPHGRRGVKIIGYDGTPSLEAFERLNRLIGTRPFHVELGRIYSLDEAALAHRQIEEHHLGKMALRLHA